MNGPADAGVRRRLALRARSIRPQNWMRAEVESYQAELLTELDVLNRQADELVQRRKEIVEQLELCRAALGGEATKLRRQLPLPGEVSAVPGATRRLPGRELRAATVEVLRGAGRPLRIDEIHRLLLCHGVDAAGRPAKAISDALRTEVGAGRVARVRRGLYAWREFASP